MLVINVLCSATLYAVIGHVTNLVDRDLDGRIRPFLLTFLVYYKTFFCMCYLMLLIWSASMLVRRKLGMRELRFCVVLSSAVAIVTITLITVSWLQHILSHIQP